MIHHSERKRSYKRYERKLDRFENKHTRRLKETRRLRRRFESFNGQDTFDETYRELQKVAKEFVKEYGDEVTDEMNVVFWAKDQDGTPCLAEGAYNAWSGDEELTITEIANGMKPERFISKLDKCFVDAVPYIAENCARHVIDRVNEDYGLDLSFDEVKESCFDGLLDYEALYDYIIETYDEIEDDMDDFVSSCQDSYESDYFDESYSFGWEYSTVNQGNLFYGRSNSDFAKGCIFIVSVSMFGETDDCSYAGETDIDEDGLQKLADAIDSGKTESPRW